MNTSIPAWLRHLSAAFLLLLGSACSQPSAHAQATQQGLPDGDYYLVSQLSYKPMTAVDSGEAGVQVRQHAWTPEHDAGQIWTLRRQGDGYTLRSKKFASFLAIADDSQEVGASAVAIAGEPGRRQRWWLQAHADAYSIVAAHSGQALGVDGALREEGTDYLQWEAPSHAENELFLLIRADGQGQGRHGFDDEAVANSSYDNQQRRYHLSPLLPAALDADRMRRMKLMEYHPSGLYIRQGEVVQFDVDGLAPGRDALVLMVGQANAFIDAVAANAPQLWMAQPGHNQFTASRSGMLYFRYIDSGFGSAPLPDIDVHVVQGGMPTPFYIAGQTSAAQWRHMLATRASPYVEMLGPRAVITVRRDMLDRSRHTDPGLLLAYLDKMVGYHDDISGLDGSSELDRPSPLRLHYLQDDRSSAKSLDGIFMYAGDHFVGMPDDSALALLNDPARSDPWGLWHEAGHVYQQSDWTWGVLTEVTVNIYSLHAQQRFGLPSRLDEVDPESGNSHWDWARLYLAQTARDFNDDASFPQQSSNWARLVMYEQLRQGLGDGFFKQLHKAYRREPLDFAQRSDENVMVQEFIYRSCMASNQDLSSFFVAWGLVIDADTQARIEELGVPATDLLAMP